MEDVSKQDIKILFVGDIVGGIGKRAFHRRDSLARRTNPTRARLLNNQPDREDHSDSAMILPLVFRQISNLQ